MSPRVVRSTSISDLAEAMGIASGQHLPAPGSKADLFRQVMERYGAT
jgi:hypothetical protein